MPKVVRKYYHNGVEYKIKFPVPHFEYSYTFKWKTSSQISSDWTTLIWAIATNSEWVTWTSSQEMRIAKSINLEDATKIIITWTVVWQNNTKTAWAILIWKWTWWGTWLTWYEVEWSYYDWLNVAYSNWTTYHWNRVWYATAWTYKTTTEIDLVNKKITWKCEWYSNSEYTLSDSDVNNIKTFNQLIAYTSLATSTISDIGITIEY